jgi:1-acyl-sn-glycerol-3-phosphate acyltransferase
MGDVLRRQWRELRLNFVPREFAYWLVQNFLLLMFRFTMRVQVLGGEHYTPPARATLLLCSHKRDWDPLLCATRLYYQRGWWRPDGRRMAFVGREDMFTRGFLAEIVGYREWPRWTRWLLDHVTLTPIIALLRAYPIVRLLEFSTRQYLFELRVEQGNLPLTEVFSDEFLEHLDRWAAVLAQRSRSFRPRSSRELRISDILTWDYREVLMERLRRRALLPERYEAYKTRQREKITRQLQAAVGALARGDTLWLAPEGMITQDGTPRRVRESLHEMLAMMPSDARILPVNVTYDFMTTGRMRACISVGPPLMGLHDLDRRDLGKAVIAAITGQTVVTMSMLGSRFLWERLQQDEPVFTFEAAWEALARNVQLFAKQGAALEQGLRDARRARRRLRAFLAYGLRHGLLNRQPDRASGSGRLRELGSRILAPVGRSRARAYGVNPAPFQQQRESFFWVNPRYSVNELAALEAALAQRAGSIIARS